MANIPKYVDSKNGKIAIEYYHKDLQEILRPTYGVIVYQEQVMQIAQTIAGYTMAQADILRRAMGKKDPATMAKEGEVYLGAIKKGYKKS